MSKNKEKMVLDDELDVKKEKKNKKRKKMTAAEKNRIIMKVMGFIMAAIMIMGVLIGFLAYFI